MFSFDDIIMKRGHCFQTFSGKIALIFGFSSIAFDNVIQIVQSLRQIEKSIWYEYNHI